MAKTVVKVDMIRTRIAVTIDGTEYRSRTEAAKALVASGKSLSETVKIIEAATGKTMTYQTVYSVTKGAEKVAHRRTHYRILSLGKSGRKTASEIANKVGVSTPKVVSLLKKAGIVVLTKEAQAKLVADVKAKKDAAKPVKTPKAKKSTKTPRAKKVTEPVWDGDDPERAAAMADMASEGIEA